MKSIRTLGYTPTSLPLPADDIIELHASRLLLLLHNCGFDQKIEGLTKLAKLDFFVRYPSFFEQAANYLGKKMKTEYKDIESHMVRHHYGPWDKRYYQVLAFLEARELIKVQKIGKTYEFILTELGQEKANHISKASQFTTIIKHMVAVRKILGRKNGTQLKNIVYEIFDEEVKKRKLGEIIK